MRVIFDKMLVTKLTVLVRQILLAEWDPLDVENVKQAQDEYDDYIPRICYLILAKESSERIMDYLVRVENYMGLRETKDMRRIDRVARILAAIDTDNIK